MLKLVLKFYFEENNKLILYGNSIFNSAVDCLEEFIRLSKQGYYCKIEDHSYYEKK